MDDGVGLLDDVGTIEDEELEVSHGVEEGVGLELVELVVSHGVDDGVGVEEELEELEELEVSQGVEVGVGVEEEVSHGVDEGATLEDDCSPRLRGVALAVPMRTARSKGAKRMTDI